MRVLVLLLLVLSTSAFAQIVPMYHCRSSDLDIKDLFVFQYVYSQGDVVRSTIKTAIIFTDESDIQFDQESSATISTSSFRATFARDVDGAREALSINIDLGGSSRLQWNGQTATLSCRSVRN